MDVLSDVLNRALGRAPFSNGSQRALGRRVTVLVRQSLPLVMPDAEM